MEHRIKEFSKEERQMDEELLKTVYQLQLPGKGKLKLLLRFHLLV